MGVPRLWHTILPRDDLRHALLADKVQCGDRAPMSLIDISSAANDLATLLEATAPKGLRHPRHSKSIKPARAKIKAVMVHFFERQKVAVMSAIKPHIERQLLLHPQETRMQESYNPDEPRVEGGPHSGEWTSGGGGEAKEPSDRVKRAIASQVRTGQHEQAIADRSEEVLSRAIGVPRTRDNSAFDLRNDDVGIEVKTLVNGKNEKITMSKTALGRKIAEQRADGIKTFTVVVDRRTGGLTGRATYYVRDGLGSFRLGAMKEISLADLKERIKL